ncbi:hypothetical protein [Terasakiella pusilla]|uniref:hypothetical protein n=1 Tax=Terasakiella pusilla TaxID=64973 RepID=UPI003AA861B6
MSPKTKDLNFKVSPEYKRQFKLNAVLNDMTQKQWLEFCVKAGEAAALSIKK